MKNLDQFFAYSRERYRVFLRREEGEPWPWTEDPALRQYRFCNVFREDDKTTRWFRENIRDPLRDQLQVFEATLAFRWFNRIEVGELLKDLLLNGWDTEEARRRLGKFPKPHVTGAYMINTMAAPNGIGKTNGVLWCIAKNLERNGLAEQVAVQGSLQGAHQALVEHGKGKSLGAFYAYEIVTDLRYTSMLEAAPDVDTWCNLGPGAMRGLGRILGSGVDHFSVGSQRDQYEALALCREILAESRDNENWPSKWPKWEMREVEHGSCEFDKYERAKEGGRLKRLYKN